MGGGSVFDVTRRWMMKGRTKVGFSRESVSGHLVLEGKALVAVQGSGAEVGQ